MFWSMRTILAHIAALVSGAAVAQSEQELDKRMVDLWKRSLELRARELPNTARDARAWPVAPLRGRTSRVPAILHRNNDASLGPHPINDKFK